MPDVCPKHGRLPTGLQACDRCERAPEPQRYRTIVADPPWDYEEGHVTASRGTTWRGDPFKRPLPYGSMTVGEIAGLPITDLADPHGAFLFLWTTSRYLPAAFEIVAAWGFDYRQTLVWHKVKSVAHLGGAIAPNHAEFLLLGRRGPARLSGRLSSSVIAAPGNSGRRVGAHSRKPEAFLDHIESVSPGPYVELFARRARFGWDYWGDQSLGTAGIPISRTCVKCAALTATSADPLCDDCGTDLASTEGEAA